MAKTVNVSELIARLKADRERLKKENEALKARVGELIAEQVVFVEKNKVVVPAVSSSPDTAEVFSPQVCQTGKMVWLFVLVNTIFFILLVVWIAWLGNLQTPREYPLMDEWIIEEDAGDMEPPPFPDSDGEGEVIPMLPEQPDTSQIVCLPCPLAVKKKSPESLVARKKAVNLASGFFSGGPLYLPPPLASATLKIRSRWFRPADTDSE